MRYFTHVGFSKLRRYTQCISSTDNPIDWAISRSAFLHSRLSRSISEATSGRDVSMFPELIQTIAYQQELCYGNNCAIETKKTGFLAPSSYLVLTDSTGVEVFNESVSAWITGGEAGSLRSSSSGGCRDTTSPPNQNILDGLNKLREPLTDNR